MLEKLQEYTLNSGGGVKEVDVKIPTGFSSSLILLQTRMEDECERVGNPNLVLPIKRIKVDKTSCVYKLKNSSPFLDGLISSLGQK